MSQLLATTPLTLTEHLELVFEARGTLPPQGWTADLQACVGLRSEVHYFHFIF